MGDRISFGETGPKFVVSATAEVAPTGPEQSVFKGTEADAPPPLSHGAALLDRASGRRYEARGLRIRIGRGRECEIRVPVDAVSRVHAELLGDRTGAYAIRDAGSKNGTWLNDARVGQPTPVGLGDRVMLGQGGPVLVVEALGALRDRALPEPEPPGARRSSTYLRAVAVELGSASGRHWRSLTVVACVLAAGLGGAVFGVYRMLSGELEASERRAETAADSTRVRETALAEALAAARAAAAPTTEVDSLRAALESAQVRTAALGAAMARAQQALGDQLAAGETHRLAAQAELDRLRAELAAAERPHSSRRVGRQSPPSGGSGGSANGRRRGQTARCARRGLRVRGRAESGRDRSRDGRPGLPLLQRHELRHQS